MGTADAGDSSVRLLRLPKVRSPSLHNYRDLLVATPPGYDDSLERYPVVYMHDGQNLFDPATSFAGDWSLLGTVATLAARGIEILIVGVANTGRFRRYEYSPFREKGAGGGDGELYLAFMVDTIKPLVDESFRTRRDPESTIVAGSSLGGLMSLYALFERPDVFGTAAALSPSAWYADEAILNWVRPPSPGMRLYLDVGTGEADELVTSVRRLHERLETAGWASHAGYRYVEAPGARHHESAWGDRFRRALPFLTGREPAEAPPEPA